VVGACFRECANRGKECSYCVFYSQYKPIRKGSKHPGGRRRRINTSPSGSSCTKKEEGMKQLVLAMVLLFFLGEYSYGADVEVSAVGDVITNPDKTAVDTDIKPGVAYEIKAEDIRRMSKGELDRFLLLMVFFKEYNITGSGELVDELYKKALPRWVYKRGQEE